MDYRMVSKLIWSLFLVNYRTVLTSSVEEYVSGEIVEQDYCAGNPVEAKCGLNEVVMAMNATYGRMRKNDCVKVNVGYLGCGINVLSVLDFYCSGRQQCSMMVPNEGLDLKNDDTNCLSELKVYLRASYTCEKVYPVPQGSCSHPVRVPVTSQGGYISSLAPYEKSCDPQETVSWNLEAQPGQRIHLTLVDFKWSDDPERLQSCPYTYGYIKDQSTNEMRAICGGRQRVRSLEVVSSEAHKVQIEIGARPASADPYNFLIHYKAVGCADLTPPRHAWLTRDLGSDEATVGCHDTKQTWHLKCVDQSWKGVIGNCTQHLVAARQAASKLGGGIAIPHAFVIFLIIAIAVTISMCIIIVGIFILRRYRVQSLKRIPIARQHVGEIYEEPKFKVKIPVYDAHNHPGQPQQRNEYTHIWEYPLPEPLTHAPEGPIINDSISRDPQPVHGSHVRSDSTELDHLRRYYALDKDALQEGSPLVTTIIT